MTAPTISWGILGAGQVADGFAKDLRLVSGARLAAVASRDSAKARAFAARHGDVRVFETYDQLASDPDIHVIYVATPNDRHAADVLRCLKHGKAVLCEKPFTIGIEEARRVVDEARRRQLFLMEAMWMRFMPAVRRVTQLVNEGAIGEVRTLFADFSISAPVDPASRLFNPKRGGGALLDLGVYTLSLAQLLLGEPTTLDARLSFGPTDVDEHAAIVLGYESGATAVLTSAITSQGANCAVISGSSGSITLRGPICAPTALEVSRIARSSTRRLGCPKPSSALIRSHPSAIRATQWLRDQHRLLLGRRTTTRMPVSGNGYELEAAEVVRCLRDGLVESPAQPLDDTLRVIELMSRVRRQVRSSTNPPTLHFRVTDAEDSAPPIHPQQD